MKICKTAWAIIPARGPLVLFFYVLVLSGCSESDVPHTDYFPLRDGNHWEYRLLDTPLLKRLADGQVIATTPQEDLKHNNENTVENEPPKADVVEDAFLEPGRKLTAKSASNNQKTKAGAGEGGGSPLFARRVVLDLLAAVDDLTYHALYDTAEQVWSKRSGYVGFQSNRGRSYLLILPPHTGYRWVVTGPAGQDLYYEIESAAATVATPAGQFQYCVIARQESRDRREIFRYWFAPNVGLVRRSKYFMTEEVFRQELIDYKVKPATTATRAAEEREVKKAIEGKHRGSEFRKRSEGDRESRLDDIDKADKNNNDDPQNDKVNKYGDPK